MRTISSINLDSGGHHTIYCFSQPLELREEMIVLAIYDLGQLRAVEAMSWPVVCFAIARDLSYR